MEEDDTKNLAEIEGEKDVKIPQKDIEIPCPISEETVNFTGDDSKYMLWTSFISFVTYLN